MNRAAMCRRLDARGCGTPTRCARNRRQGQGNRWPDLREPLLPSAKAAGYEGSARNFRRAVAESKSRWASAAAGVPNVDADPGRALGDRLASEGGWHVLVRGAAVVALPVRARRPRPEGSDHDAAAVGVLRDPRRRAEGRARRSHGLPHGAASSPTSSSRPLTTLFATHVGFRPTSAKLSPQTPSKRWCHYAQEDLIVPATRGLRRRRVRAVAR